MKHTVTLLLFILASTGYANRFYVDASASEGGDGSSWESAFQYFQDALDQTVAGRNDEVWIADGTYYPDDGANVAEGDREATFYIVEGVRLYGGFAGGETDISQRDWNTFHTILSGEIYTEQEFWSLHVITTLGAVYIDGVNVVMGNSNGESGSLNSVGGGIFSLEGLIRINNSRIADNHSSTYGAGIHGEVFATNCTFDGNVAKYYGGAIEGNNVQSAYGDVENCYFLNNSAKKGGAVCRLDSIKNCIFENNTTSSGGGAVLNVSIVMDSSFIGNSSLGNGGAISGTGSVIRSTFIENTSGAGGGAISGEFEIINSCFYRNSALGGGAVSGDIEAVNTLFIENAANFGGAVGWPAELIHCTFYGNTATEMGGALFADNGEFALFGNLFWNNSDSAGGVIHGDVTNISESFPSPNPIRDRNLIQGGGSSIVGLIDFGDNSEYLIEGDPNFINPDDPDGADDIWGTIDDGLRLDASSPCISKGASKYLPADEWDLDEDDLTSEVIPVDFGYFHRIQGDLPDLGAYEYGNATTPIFTLSIVAEIGGETSPSGLSEQPEGTVIQISAEPSDGYLFSNWTGDLSSSENPFQITMTANVSITANFTPDLNDPDEDGLSNFDEIVTYGSNPGLPDTDNDGISDGDEVIGLLDPTVDNSATIQMFQENSGYLPKLFDQEAYEANYQAGVDSVLNNPTQHDLFSPDQVAGVDFNGLAVGMDSDGIFRIRFGLQVSEDFSTWTIQPLHAGEVSVEGEEIEIQFSSENPNSTFYQGTLKTAN